MALVTLSRGSMSVHDATGLCVSNIGQMSGSATFTLTETADNSRETVFNVIQGDANDSVSFSMAGNDGNISFNGYNMYAAFDAECENGYNVELNTINSQFNFLGTRSGAMISTTAYSMNNVVQLGGGSNIVHAETIDGSLTPSGQAENFFFNNVVSDSGYSNTFLSAFDSYTKFETTSSSVGAYMQGGYGNDVYNIGGSYGVFNGVGGENVFTTAEFRDMYNTSSSNVVFGGVGTNAYNDYGIGNMYQGAYALYQDTQYAGMNGYDTLRMNGYYGIARVDASALPEGYDPSVFYNGSYNAVFTGENASFEYNGRTYNISYRDVLNGKYADYQRADGTTWTLSDFYGSSYSPTGYAFQYGYSLLSRVLDY